MRARASRQTRSASPAPSPSPPRGGSLWAQVFVGNHATRRVLEKNGYDLDGTLRGAILKGGEWRDLWFFTLLRAEWDLRREWYRPRREQVQ